MCYGKSGMTSSGYSQARRYGYLVGLVDLLELRFIFGTRPGRPWIRFWAYQDPLVPLNEENIGVSSLRLDSFLVEHHSKLALSVVHIRNWPSYVIFALLLKLMFLAFRYKKNSSINVLF